MSAPLKLRKRKRDETSTNPAESQRNSKRAKSHENAAEDARMKELVTVDRPNLKKGSPEALSSNWAKLKAAIAPSEPTKASDIPVKAVPWWVKKDAAKREAKEKAEKEAAQAAEQAAAAQVRAGSRFQVKPMSSIEWQQSSDSSVTQILALDCEMVGVGVDGGESALAQVCIVNEHGTVIYNEYVQTVEKVVDYRTEYSGIRPSQLKPHRGALPFQTVQAQVAELIKDRILVGHSLDSDLKALMLQHPKSLLRDTAHYRPLQRARRKPHALRHLARTILGIQIQTGEHDPAEDARAALLLYKHLQKDWERWLKEKAKKAPKKKRPHTAK